MAVGDANIAFLHNSLKWRNHRPQIKVIIDSNGVRHEGGDVSKAFVDHYVKILGSQDDSSMPDFLWASGPMKKGIVKVAGKRCAGPKRKVDLESNWLRI
ncbi:hypothetical protein QVD17_24289 [Tagetes erecta]|uniref:Uncharacterized protein n=1 Tax=Tagetes erecta TaxID=13708 RepID=A0AAD8NMP2_TARER|nr:hypothetical protein QVD17_24289 [Tagetes erecta]